LTSGEDAVVESHTIIGVQVFDGTAGRFGGSARVAPALTSIRRLLGKRRLLRWYVPGGTYTTAWGASLGPAR
jgi:hypothetical protein